jgi:hypothetical protein
MIATFRTILRAIADEPLAAALFSIFMLGTVLLATFGQRFEDLIAHLVLR